MRRIPSPDDRALERAQISARDMQQATAFIDAALALDAEPEKYSNKMARLALEIAAVIYYTRPFTGNERTKKTQRAPARGAPRLGKTDLGPLRGVLTTAESRALHRDALAVRHKVIAHADSRYFPVRLVKAFRPPAAKLGRDFAILSAQRFPRLDLHQLRANASQLCAAFALHAHYAAIEVRKTRRRLRHR
jgi:hypothetical protein